MEEHLISKLKTVREKANHTQHKLSAVILKKGRPISFGFNDQKKTDPKIRQWSPVKTLHAEAHACFRVRHKFDFTGCTMVVYREDREGNPTLARPCEVCLKMLKDFKFRFIVYSTPEGFKEEKL